MTDKDGNVDADFNDEFSYDVDGQSDIVTFKDGVSTNLQKIKDGQTITIKGLPQDKYYRVVESANGSYRTSYTLENLTTVDTDGNETNETDTFQMQQGKDAATGIVKFTNEGKTTHFGFSKLIEGPNAKADKDKEFSFMMKIMNESGALDTDFSGEIEGIKHTGSGDANVTFDFENGEAKEVIYSDGSISDIKLKTGESYRNIKLPANVKVKVYENKMASIPKFITRLAMVTKMKPATRTRTAGRPLARSARTTQRSNSSTAKWSTSLNLKNWWQEICRKDFKTSSLKWKPTMMPLGML